MASLEQLLEVMKEEIMSQASPHTSIYIYTVRSSNQELRIVLFKRNK